MGKFAPREVAATARKIDLQERIAALERMRDALSALIHTCELPRTARSCPLLEAIHAQEAEGTR